MFPELSRIIERIEAPDTQHIGSILRQICCAHTILDHTSIGRIGNTCHTCHIGGAGTIGSVCSCAAPPSLGVRFCSTGGCRLVSHRTVPNIFRYWLDYESCFGSVSASSVVSGFVAYYVNGGVDFLKHVVLDMCLYLTNDRTPLASRVN